MSGARRTLVRNASVVLPGEIERTSVLFDGGRVAAVDAPASVRADETVDATGLHLLPGVVDDHVHFRDPGLTRKEDLRSGSRAAAAGGVTSFLDMPNTAPPTVTAAALEAKLARASRRSVVDYGFYVGAAVDNLAELRRARRACGIKIFMGSSTGDMLVDDQERLEAIFAETSLPIAAHCEDEATVRANAARLTPPLDVRDHSRIRDERAAVVATTRAVDLAKRHRRRLHVLHVSTAREAEIVRDHRGFVTAEACPHHLFLDVSDYDRLGARALMNPALKTAADREALWRGLAVGDLQVVATDHAPHTLAEKDAPYGRAPAGVPGVETALPLMLDQVARGRCALLDVVGWMCDAPARVWDMVGKGRIEVGYDADAVLVDMNARREVRDERQRSKCEWSPWHGARLQGWPVRTWVRGRTVYAAGRVETEPVGEEIVFDRERGGYWATRGD